MGPFSTAVDLIGVLNKLTETNDEDISKTISALNNTKSITERAKKALFVYPVLFSPGVSDIKIATKISKFLEIQYGIFTTMTVGLMPSVEDGNISNYLNSIAAEGYDYSKNIKMKIQNVNPNHVELWYEEFKRSNEDFFEEYKGYEKEDRSLEDIYDSYNLLIDDSKAIDGIVSGIGSKKDISETEYNEYIEKLDHYNNHLRQFENEYSNLDQSKKNRFNQSGADINSIIHTVSDSNMKMKSKCDKYINSKNEKEKDELKKKYQDEIDNIKNQETKFNNLNPLDINEDELEARATTDAYKTIDKLKAGNPTMITLKVKIKGYDQDFAIPIGLKANPHFVSQSDLAALFDSAIEDKRLLTRLVKLSSGEISFFKDFVFAMDRAKRDQKLYAKFGQHPWYRQFVQRKENNKLKRLGIIFSTILGKFKGVVSSTSNFLPTATIVMTLDECERSTKMKYGFLLKNEKILWSVLNQLGLLCICIYNPELETCSFYFNGFKKPMLVALSEMKSDKEDANAEMAKVMQLMMKRGIM